MTKIKKRMSLPEKREQLNFLLSKIENHEGAFPFDVISPEILVQQIEEFKVLDQVFIQNKFKAQSHNQLRLSDNKKLVKLIRVICQYLKVKYESNTKKLGDWGITLVLNKSGKIMIPSRLLAQQELAFAILAKHKADAQNSILNRFDMVEFENLLNNILSNKELFKNAQIIWRSKNMYRKQALDNLEKTLSRLAKDLRCNTDLLPKDLEIWSFVITEFHKILDVEEKNIAS